MADLFRSIPIPKDLPPSIKMLMNSEEPAQLPLPLVRPMSDCEKDSHAESTARDMWQVQRTPETSMPPEPLSSSATPPRLPVSASFRPVNEASSKKPTPKKPKSTVGERQLASLAPAPPRPQHPLAARQLAPQPQTPRYHGKNLYDIPAEIRVEIYKLVLENVTIHILPGESWTERQAPHALTRVSRVVRNEVLPIIHSNCAIEAMVTDFNFSGMLEFMARIPPQDVKALTKNDRLKIQLCTTGEKSKGSQQAVSDSASLRKWLQYRADKYKLQPRWEYSGIWPGRKVESDIRRRIKRMTEDGKKQELINLASSIGLQRLEGTPKP